MNCICNQNYPYFKLTCHLCKKNYILKDMIKNDISDDEVKLDELKKKYNDLLVEKTSLKIEIEELEYIIQNKKNDKIINKKNDKIININYP